VFLLSGSHEAVIPERYRGAASANDVVQKAQRRAAMGTSLRHSGHFLVVGSGAASPRRIRARSVFIGSTSKYELLESLQHFSPLSLRYLTQTTALRHARARNSGYCVKCPPEVS